MPLPTDLARELKQAPFWCSGRGLVLALPDPQLQKHEAINFGWESA
jgi:hypothetical protein